MNRPSPEFHKIWIDQCVATEGIRESFGLKDSQDYLIGQKLFTFLMVSERDPQFAAEIPSFAKEIQHIFTAVELRDYFNTSQAT
jgi:hypothetical protein